MSMQPGDSESKEFRKQDAAGVNGLLSQAFSNNQGGGAGAAVMNSSSIEQQLDLKYKAYSMMQQNQQQPGALGKMSAATPTGMLPNTSQYLYASSNLRTSLDKPLNSDGALSVSDLPMSGQNASHQQQQQFLNMNASLGSQQNQNLGPTQIFYQGVPPMQHQSTASTSQLSFATGSTQNNNQVGSGLPPTSGQGANQNIMQQNALVQLMAQQQQQQMQSNSGNQQNIFGNNATQLLLMELLRQNNLQQSLSMVQQPADANPSNQSMYGSGFATATQLLAQSQQQQPGSEATPQPSKESNPVSQVLSQQAQTQPRVPTRDGADVGYSQNLQQIYNNLNNYQSMIENLETGNTQTANRNQNQYEALNQSKYQGQSMLQQSLPSSSVEILHQSSVNKNQGVGASGNSMSFTPQSMQRVPQYERDIDFESHQPQQRDRSDSGGRTGSSPHGRSVHMTTNELGMSQHRPSSSSQQHTGERDLSSSNSHQRSRGVRDYENIRPGSRHQDLILEERGESGEKSPSNHHHEMSRGAFEQREEDEQIMWPSSAVSVPTASCQQDLRHHQKSTSGDANRQNFMNNQESSVSGIEWMLRPKQGAASRQGQQLSAEEGEDSSNFNMHTDFNYREDNSSGFDRDLQHQRSNEASNARNHWMRQSSRSGVDIDEIPIPTSGGGPKTFEELLAEKMEAEAALGQVQEEPKAEEPVPKRQFLKRKKPAYVPPPKPPTKQYKYYSDAITKSKDGSSVGGGDEHHQQDGRSSRRQIGQISDEQRNDRRRVRTPNAVAQSSSGRQNSEANMRHEFTQNQVEVEGGGGRQRNASAAHNQSSTPTNAGQARPFLKRGTGTAHLQGRLRSANPGSSNNLHKQQQSQSQPQESKPATPKLEKGRKDGPIGNKGREHAPMGSQAAGNSPLDDFQKLEQDCNRGDPGKGLHQHEQQQQQQQQPRQQRKKKLFDSDSEVEGEDAYHQQREQAVSAQKNQYSAGMNLGRADAANRNQSPENQGRSNLVKKMFYKESAGASSMSKKQERREKMEDDEAKPYMNAQMDALLQKRQDQLEKAIQRYNVDNEALVRQKAQYDALIRKVKAEQRDLDVQRKRAQDDVDKMKEEELLKLRKEKRALEQRQKNFQQVSTTAKKEREEIDQLRREYNKYKSDAELKAKKQQSQIERLTKQNNELKQKNKEMQEDLRAMEQQRIILERGGPQSVGAGLNQSQNNQVGNRSTSNQPSRYTFQQQQQQQQQNKRGPTQSRQQANQQQQQEMKNQMLFQDEEEEQEQDQEADQDHVQNDYEQEQRQRQYADEDEDEEDLQAEEADQVYDDFSNLSRPNFAKQHEAGLDDDQDEDETNAAPANMPQAQAAASDEEEDFSLKFPKEYHSKTLQNQKVVEQYVGHDGKIQRIYQNGKKEVIFNNGVKRESFPDGYTIVYFNNQDMKQTFPDGKVVYYFAEAQTTQTTFPDKLQVFKFSNNQIEKHFPDKTKEIIFPDGTIKCIFEDGEEESIFPDGTIQKIEKSGVKAIEFANGQKDILYPDGIRVREFPDGKVRKTYPDGRTEVFQR